MKRFNLSQLIQFLINENHIAMAMHFADFAQGNTDPNAIVDGRIAADIVKCYVDDLDESGQLLRKIQANVIAYMRLPLTDASMRKSI